MLTDTDPPFQLGDLAQAYLACRRHKRHSASCQAFEAHLERNLLDLQAELLSGRYRPGRSICFVITHPKPREVWAATFRDRVVHHLLYAAIAPRFLARFTADSCACIPGRGTLYGVQRLEHQVRSCSANWSRPAHFLKCDLANFFVSIDKRVLQRQLHQRVTEPFWRWLTDTVLMHDPRPDVILQATPAQMALVPEHKRLGQAAAHCGLPIGNLSSQFFANVYLDALDQFVKHELRAPHYVRYVDDFVLVHPSPQWLNAAHARIEAFLPAQLGAQLNPSKTVMQPVAHGIDFCGQVIRPHRRTTRPRTLRTALQRVEFAEQGNLHQIANSYFGLLGQATHSHHERCRLGNALRKRGRAISGGITQIYPRRHAA